jgi:secreted Zn-dependent insulinase-like peptidase
MCKLTLITASLAEGAGSLLSLLKEKGWATGLSAGVGDGGYDHSSAGYMFSVNIGLTDSGLEHVSPWAIASFVLYVPIYGDFLELQQHHFLETTLWKI